MVSESLARRFRPAGFEQPEGSRREYVKPRPELQEAFDKWVEKLPERRIYPASHIVDSEILEILYHRAMKLIDGFGEIKTDEANSLLVDFKPKTNYQRAAGLFVSACYTHSPEETIIFDVDAPEIDLIGYWTKKPIFNNGSVRSWFAPTSSSMAVNNGVCGKEFACSSTGPVVNNGDCDGWFAHYASGLIIALKFTQKFGWTAKSDVVCSADCGIPELKQYLEELSKDAKSVANRESAKMFLEKYGTNGEKIVEEIKKLRIGGIDS